MLKETVRVNITYNQPLNTISKVRAYMRGKKATSVKSSDRVSKKS